MNLREVLARRDAIRVEMQAINDAAPPGGALTGEAETRWAALTAELARLRDSETRAATLAELDMRAAGTPIGGQDAQFANLLAGYSFTRALAISASILPRDGREAEVATELERRSGQSFTGFAVPVDAVRFGRIEQRALTAAGGAAPLISTEVGPVIDRLRPASILARVGATYLNDLRGNLSLPALTASASAQWVPDGTDLTESDQTLGPVAMSPKSVGALTEYSRQTLLQASPDVDNLIRSDFAKLLAAAIDGAAISGSGTSGQPKGILNTAGIGSVAMGTNGGALTYGAVQDLIGSVDIGNAPADSRAFVTNTKVRAAVRKMVDGQSRPLTEGVVFGSDPVIYSNTVTAAGTKGSGTGLSTLVYGDWSELLIGVWSALDIVSNGAGASFARGGVQVRAFASVDVAVRHAASFGAITDIAA